MDLMRIHVLALALTLSACPARTELTSDAPASSVTSPRPASDLLAPETFGSIADRSARSVALFVEASRVMTSPRCANCHPADDSPRQGDDHALHDPPVARGPADLGVPGLECTSCHQDRNAELARIPGAPKWHLAPKAMAWLGKTAPEICEQVKDPARNGGRSLAQLVDHSAHDELVAWGWHPGADRKPAPGDQARFGALIAAWVETGAACPTSQTSPASPTSPTKEVPR
jgi:hypothetical protein